MKKLLALLLALMLLPLAGVAEEVRLPGGLCWGMDEYQVEGAFGRAPDEKNQGVLGFDGEGRRILFSYRAYYGAKLLDRTVKTECILCRGGLVMLQITGQPEQLPEAELREALTATCGPSQPIAGEEIVRRMTALMGGASLGLMPGDGECWQLSPDTQLWFVAPGGVAGLMLANVDAGGAAVATPEPPAWPQAEPGTGDTLAAGELPADLMPHGLTMGASYEQVFGALRGSQMGSYRLESLGLVQVYNDVIFGDAVGSQYLLVDDELRLITAVWLEEQPGEGHDRLVSKLTQRLGEPRQRSAEKMRAIAEARVGEGFTPTTDGLCWQIAPDTELWVIREAGTVGLVWVSVPPAEQFGGVRLGMSAAEALPLLPATPVRDQAQNNLRYVVCEGVPFCGAACTLGGVFIDDRLTLMVAYDMQAGDGAVRAHLEAHYAGDPRKPSPVKLMSELDHLAGAETGEGPGAASSWRSAIRNRLKPTIVQSSLEQARWKAGDGTEAWLVTSSGDGSALFFFAAR